MVLYWIVACPPGFTPKDGMVSRFGLTGSYEATLDKFATDCISNADCNSLEYNFKSNLCKLAREDLPTEPKVEGTTSHDYQFCAKIK